MAKHAVKSRCQEVRRGSKTKTKQQEGGWGSKTKNKKLQKSAGQMGVIYARQSSGSKWTHGKTRQFEAGTQALKDFFASEGVKKYVMRIVP